MERRCIALGLAGGIIILSILFFSVRPVTGTWVCTDRLTPSAMLTDEITTITLRPDGTADFRSYGDYLGRYRIRQGSGRWEPAGTGKFRIAVTQGTDVSCQITGNCTFSGLVPFAFSIDYDIIRDTVTYDPAAAPEFSGIRPFVRSIMVDCSEGCPGY